MGEEGSVIFLLRGEGYATPVGGGGAVVWVLKKEDF